MIGQRMSLENTCKDTEKILLHLSILVLHEAFFFIIITSRSKLLQYGR